jgi:hypothetical protein
MQEFLTEETPGKVMALLGGTLFSLALLFAVNVSGASLGGSTEYALPDPFAPAKVVQAIDNFSAWYSGGLVAFAEPATMAVKAHTEAMAWAMDEASVPLVRVLGLESLVEYNSQPQVAGISTKADFGFLGFGSLSVDQGVMAVLEV